MKNGKEAGVAAAECIRGRWREQRVRNFLICDLESDPNFFVLSWRIWEGVSVGYVRGCTVTNAGFRGPRSSWKKCRIRLVYPHPLGSSCGGRD